MGRKTWESLPGRPLPGRLNIVVSGTMRETGPDVKVFPSLPAAIGYCSAYPKIFICGGASIYREALPLADRIELTLIRQNYEGYTFFPEIDSARWTQSSSLDFDTFSFVSYTRKMEMI